MGRIKYFVVFLLLLVSCKQYSDVIEKEEKSLKDKSESEVSEEGKEEVKKTPEESLREKLSENQKKGLDFLKEALGDEAELNKLLGLGEGKVKGALEHIQQQLDSCKGDNASEGKETFKEVVKGALGAEGTNLNQLTEAVTTCSTS
ncbi:hypothetical protein DB313_04775 (plasmid) [Borrelia turcica IST7]|uniref:Mlp family lipoprotein n=2 Tax=Borrelia turcica TaxID=229155 RepID=A0A386PMM1_9SPIR|nr:hypothetical protein DB313_04775 [Borrelia turcica IST7]